jgi:hypothetical protein
MTKKMNDITDADPTVELWGNAFTAQVLSDRLIGRDAEQWTLWLRNNRNQSRRAPYRIPFTRISNGTFYHPADIEKFVDWEKSRQLGTMKLTGRSAEVMRAFGIGSAAGSTTGRKLEIIGINQQEDQGTGEFFVQLIIGDPLLVYRLTPEQAAQMAADLLCAAGIRHAEPTQR